MGTLIAVYNSEGLVGRCDANCYEARHPECDCVCGGMNHGAGLDRAIDNTRRHAEQMVERYAGGKGLKNFKSALGDEVIQGNLW